jgi:hypothetical protein
LFFYDEPQTSLFFCLSPPPLSSVAPLRDWRAKGLGYPVVFGNFKALSDSAGGLFYYSFIATFAGLISK